MNYLENKIMKKYETLISIRESKPIRLLADSREHAVELIQQDCPGWTFDAITEIVKEETEEEDGDYIDHEIYGFCESSGKPIFYGDYYYQWDDSVMTHLEYGGADETHKPVLAE